MATNRSNHSDDSFGEWSINPGTSDDQPSADTPANAWRAVDGSQWEQPEGKPSICSSSIHSPSSLNHTALPPMFQVRKLVRLLRRAMTTRG